MESYAATVESQMRRNGVTLLHGRGSFDSPHVVCVSAIDGSKRSLRAGIVIIAAGSRPRHPEGMPIDHEHVLDSDSILNEPYEVEDGFIRVPEGPGLGLAYDLDRMRQRDR